MTRTEAGVEAVEAGWYRSRVLGMVPRRERWGRRCRRRKTPGAGWCSLCRARGRRLWQILVSYLCCKKEWIVNTKDIFFEFKSVKPWVGGTILYCTLHCNVLCTVLYLPDIVNIRRRNHSFEVNLGDESLPFSPWSLDLNSLYLI